MQPGSLRGERDAASRWHTSGLPAHLPQTKELMMWTQAPFCMWCHGLLSADDYWLLFTHPLDTVYTDGIPHSVNTSCSISFFIFSLYYNIWGIKAWCMTYAFCCCCFNILSKGSINCSFFNFIHFSYIFPDLFHMSGFTGLIMLCGLGYYL